MTATKQANFPPPEVPLSPAVAAWVARLKEEILLLDGAMGTMIQRHELAEADFRGDRFQDHPRDLRGNNDLLSLTRPDLIRDIHLAYLEAGSTVIETNTFNSTRTAQADYGLENLVPELNRESARLAAGARDRHLAEHPGANALVAGVLGPTNRTASLSPDVNRPGYRAISFDDLVAVYREAAEALAEGGADFLMVETIFDTLNAKAALFALSDFNDCRDDPLPVWISVTVTDASGRTLSGQTVEAFWNSVAHADPLVVGLNCALGPAQMRAYLEELSRLAPCFVSCHPNAGLPNAFGGYDLGAEEMAAEVGDFAREGWLNIAGGCCGTTPEHIRAMARELRGLPPRALPPPRQGMHLSGLEPLAIG